jgi:hypothetical protein
MPDGVMMTMTEGDVFRRAAPAPVAGGGYGGYVRSKRNDDNDGACMMEAVGDGMAAEAEAVDDNVMRSRECNNRTSTVIAPPRGGCGDVETGSEGRGGTVTRGDGGGTVRKGARDDGERREREGGRAWGWGGWW